MTLHLLHIYLAVIFSTSMLVGCGQGRATDQVEDLRRELRELKAQMGKCERPRREDDGGPCECGTSMGMRSRMDRLETLMSAIILKNDIGELQEDQVDVKEHLLRRLEGLEEKMEQCLIGGQSGSNTITPHLTRIEHLVRGHFKDYRPSSGSPMTSVPKTHKDCLSAYKQGWTKSGVYRISPDGSTEMDVYCEQELDGGGWVVVQRRMDGSVDFYRTWADYKTGFGALTGEFWLGNDNLHLLTKDHNQTLKFELGSPDGEFAYVDYSSFWVEGESQKYKAHVAGFISGSPPGNSFSVNGFNFSTKDRDYDTYKASCSRLYYGGWWYGACHASNLNGLYGNTTYAKGLSWKTWTGYHISMTGTKMMVRPTL